jgi:TolB-like protein/class 3 adenylate cyclase/Tfp pilus assembly protein PilF
MERRLAAILAADVVGYSRLMREDESGTLGRLTELRKEVLEPLIAQHYGRIVKLMGDGLLVEFASVVEALTCAVAWQSRVGEREAQCGEDKRLTFRIGVNLGDVIVENQDIHGDGVNIAARLEGLADPGGVCVSGTVFDHAKGKIELAFEDLGERQVKNILESVRVYKVVTDAGKGPESRASAPISKAGETKSMPPGNASGEGGIDLDLSLPESPSIAVLPFTNMSGDPEQEFFSDGITEDIITTLSKIPTLLVIARNSTFTYKGTAIDVKQVSREQGVRYVLEGSVRKAGSRVRVTAQLIDATTGHHVWAERYDRELDDIFAVQDEITREVVVALDVRLREGEQARVWSGGTKSVEAWECIRLSQDALNRFKTEDRVDARRLIDRALELDPNYATAWFSLGGYYFHEAESGTRYENEADQVTTLDSAMKCVNKAIELDPSFADAHGLLGLCRLSKEDYDLAVATAEKGIALAPNQAENLAMASLVLNKSGKPERALELIKSAMRHCPIYPAWYLSVLAKVYRSLGRNKSAAGIFEMSLARNPNDITDWVGLAATLGELGRAEDAKRAVTEILRLHPDFSIKNYVRRLSYRDPAELTRYEDGLRKAGLPD